MPADPPPPADPPLPSDADQKLAEKKLAEHNLSSFASEFAITQEWGLFPPTESGENQAQSEILKCIEEASTAIASQQFVVANRAILKGRGFLNQVQFRRPYWYIANNRFGLLPILFTMCSAAIAYWLVFSWFLGWSVATTIHHSTFFGFAGAVLKSLYWLQFQINKGLLRPRWFAYFLVAPFVGVLLGGVAGLIVHVGFNLARGATQAAPDWRVIGLFASFAGFNWEWALDKFRIGADAVSSRLFEKKPPPEKSDKK